MMGFLDEYSQYIVPVSFILAFGAADAVLYFIKQGLEDDPELTEQGDDL